jgi:transposase
LQERRLGHKEEAEQFYRELKTQGRTVRVGMEASGHARWFERLLTELQFELWIGDAAAVRSKRVRRQKTDRQDAQLLLQLLLENRFPRIWVPDAENRDLRQLLWHRHRLVQMRTRVMNQLHVVALNEGLRRKKALWRPAGRAQLESLALAPWASQRRQDLLDLLDQLTPKIHQLTRRLEEMVEQRVVARRLRTHPGVGPLTALAFELVIGTPERFACAKQIASYVGLVAQPMGNGPDGLIVSQAGYQSAIDDLENGSFRLGRGVGSLIQNAPHVAVALRGAVTLRYFGTFFLARACSNP